MARSRSRRENVLFQYHMRVFTTGSGPGWPEGSGALKRVSGNLSAENDPLRNLDIHETRYSVGVKTTWEFDLPIFTLVTMCDLFTSLEDLGRLWDQSLWTAANIRPNGRATGVAAFAFRIRSLFSAWEGEWSRVLDEIDKTLDADLPSILSPHSRREIMVDSGDLHLSKFYIVVLQVLRISAHWIQESMDDLSLMIDDMQRLYFCPTNETDPYETFLPPIGGQAQDEAIEVFTRNWGSVKSHQQRLGKSLLTRIARTQEQVESFRDMVFNVTSVKQATKSAQLNVSIFVFAAITIFYLPLNFVVASFAIDPFERGDPSQTKTFGLAALVVAGSTYAFSAFLLWFAGKPGRWEYIKSAVLGLDFGYSVEWLKGKGTKGSGGADV